MAARVKKRKKSPVTRSDTPVSRPVAEHRTGIGVLLEKYPRAAVSAMVLALVFAELTAGGVNAWRSLGAESPYAPRSQMIADSRTVARLSEHLRAASVSERRRDLPRVRFLEARSMTTPGWDREAYPISAPLTTAALCGCWTPRDIIPTAWPRIITRASPR